MKNALKIVIVSLIAVLGLIALPASALAWGNGGNEGNGFGSHDWILYEAMRMAGSDASWIHKKTALRATDNPDKTGVSRIYHSYQERNSARGAPYMVSRQYYLAKSAYRRGDYKAASYYLGLLSHYYSDITQPYHTTKAGASSRNKYHRRYELAVGVYQREPGARRYWITPRGRRNVTDVRASTAAAGDFARTRYSTLHSAFKSSGQVKRGTTNRITREMMSRSTNDLADIIRSIKMSGGESQLPTSISTRITRTRPRQNQSIGVVATAFDANGRPVPGVRMKTVWHLSTGNKTLTTFTSDQGVAQRYLNIGSTAVGRRTPVTIYISIGSHTRVFTEYFTPTRD